MDDNGATNLCDLLPHVAGESSANPALPMYLIILSGGIPGAMLRLTPTGNRLGRAGDNTIQLPDSGVSRYHAFLKTGEDGKVRLTDLGSTNGTFLNGRRVANHTPMVVHDGDRLQFGPSLIVKFAQPDPYEERFQREMFERTVRDPLTGLYNRTYFLDMISLLADRAADRGLGLAILMLDIDHFKRINDVYGHNGGDQVLREVASVIRQSTRAEDLVARYGGEEFIVALPIAAPDQATDRAERIRRNLANRAIRVEGEEVRVTASIGVAFTSAGRRRPTAALIAAADLCLYQAKDAGRDRVACGRGALAAPPEPATREAEPAADHAHTGMTISAHVASQSAV